MIQPDAVPSGLSFHPYSLHVRCNGVAMGAGIYLEVENCDGACVLFSFLSIFAVYPSPSCTRQHDLKPFMGPLRSIFYEILG